MKRWTGTVAWSIAAALASSVLWGRCSGPDLPEHTTRAPAPPPSALPPLEAMGKPLFSCNRANFAWGSTAYGHVLDDRGQIWFYDLGKTWSPEPAGNGLYRRDGLTKRFRNLALESRRV